MGPVPAEAEGCPREDDRQTGEFKLIETASRSVLGTMNDFAYLAAAQRAEKNATDLVGLSLQLVQTPCGPLYRSHVSPDREITAYVAEHPVTR